MTWAPPPAETRRRREAHARFAATMRGEAVGVEAHRVEGGDALLCGDGLWRPVLAAFAENAASATTTTWAIYCVVDGEPTRRCCFDPRDLVTVRRRAS